MKLLVLEDSLSRTKYFIEKFYDCDITITENANSAIEYLEEEMFDCIFLDNDLGDGNGAGADVAAYLYDNPNNPNNNAEIVIHSWNIPAVAAIIGKLPQAKFVPFGSHDFYGLKINT